MPTRSDSPPDPPSHHRLCAHGDSNSQHSALVQQPAYIVEKATNASVSNCWPRRTRDVRLRIREHSIQETDPHSLRPQSQHPRASCAAYSSRTRNRNQALLKRPPLWCLARGEWRRRLEHQADHKLARTSSVFSQRHPSRVGVSVRRSIRHAARRCAWPTEWDEPQPRTGCSACS